jgi:O-antigen/teichoic acid export membrane protein
MTTTILARELKTNWKRYAVSSVITFLTGFLIAFAPQIDSITLASFGDGSLLGIIFVAIRAGVKAMVEVIIALLTNKE